MPSDKTPIVLIHGLWMPPHSWSGWIERYTVAGHTVHAPAWPGVSELGQQLDLSKAPADIRLGELVDHYDAFVRGLPAPPILMGHSFGGLLTLGVVAFTAIKVPKLLNLDLEKAAAERES